MTRVPPRLCPRIAAVAALALPAPATAHDDVAPRTDPSIPLAGTTWLASDVTGKVLYHFEPGGTFEYQYDDGRTFRNGTWRQVGSKLYIEINNKYSERSGAILGGRLVGDGWNQAGARWRWNARKTRPDRLGQPAPFR